MHKAFLITVLLLAALVIASVSFAQSISSHEFLSSDFVTFLKNKEYQKALKANDALLKKYPQDALVLRYRALTLEKFGQFDEAVKTYQQILANDPNYVPAHLFLGFAYIREKKISKAEEQLQWVIKNSGSKEYRHWAQAQLNRLRAGKSAKRIKKKPYVLGKIGIFYDSNPLLAPNNKTLAATGSKKDGALYVLDLDVGYPVVLRKDFRFDVLYIGDELLHDRGSRQVDFSSQGFALDTKERILWGDRTFLLNGRYDFRANFLRSDFFSIANRFFLGADTSFWNRTKTHFYGRVVVANYGPDGSIPSTTSRDGVRYGIGATQYFYNADYKKYIFIKQELNLNETRGDNFVRQGELTRVGLHTPLSCLGPVDLDMSTGFSLGTYPDFNSLSSLDLRERLDRSLDAYIGLTYKFKPNLATRVFYRFIRSYNDNSLFSRTRHLAGMEVVFSF